MQGFLLVVGTLSNFKSATIVLNMHCNDTIHCCYVVQDFFGGIVSDARYRACAGWYLAPPKQKRLRKHWTYRIVSWVQIIVNSVLLRGLGVFSRRGDMYKLLRLDRIQKIFNVSSWLHLPASYRDASDAPIACMHIHTLFDREVHTLGDNNSMTLGV